MADRPDDSLTTRVRTLFCGFAPAAQSAARLLLGRGQTPTSMVVLEADPDRAAAAARMGIRCVCWRVNEPLGNLDTSITKVIVDLADDLQVEPLVQRLRAALPGATITVAVRDASIISAVLQSGASAAVSEAALAGALLVAAAVGATPTGAITH
jgi:hypothetical protein